MGRRFSEQQVGDIIKRAAENQLRQRVSRHPSPEGISEDELRSVARELGIEQAALDKALSETEIVTQEDSGSLKSFNRVLVRTIDREIGDEDFAVVMEDFLPLPGTAGATSKLGKFVRYRSHFGLTPCSVSVSRRNGKTVLRIKSDAGTGIFPIMFAIAGAFLSIFIGVLSLDSASGLGQHAVEILFLPAILVSLGIWASRSINRSINGKILSALNDATARLLELSAPQIAAGMSRAQSTEGSDEIDVRTRIQD